MMKTPDFALFAAMLFVWYAVNYLPHYPVRKVMKGKLPPPQNERNRSKWRWEAWFLLSGCVAGGAVWALAGWHDGRGLVLLTLLACIALPLARYHLVAEERLAEFEVLVNILFATLAWKMIETQGTGIHGILASSVAGLLGLYPRLASYTISAGLLIFVVRGGTNVVRGVLACGGSMPPDPGSSAEAAVNPQVLTARAQLNHGRLIGDVEASFSRCW